MLAALILSRLANTCYWQTRSFWFPLRSLHRACVITSRHAMIFNETLICIYIRGGGGGVTMWINRWVCFHHTFNPALSPDHFYFCPWGFLTGKTHEKCQTSRYHPIHAKYSCMYNVYLINISYVFLYCVRIHLGVWVVVKRSLPTILKNYEFGIIFLRKNIFIYFFYEFEILPHSPPPPPTPQLRLTFVYFGNAHINSVCPVGKIHQF